MLVPSGACAGLSPVDVTAVGTRTEAEVVVAGVTAPVVEAEERSERVGVVYLHARETAVEIARIIHVVAACRPFYAKLRGPEVIVRPELDVAARLVAADDAIDIAPHLHVVDELLDDLLLPGEGEGSGDRDAPGVIGELVHRHPHVLHLLAFLLQLDVVGDARVSADVQVIVEVIHRRVVGVSRRGREREAVDLAVESGLRHVVLRAVGQEVELERRGNHGLGARLAWNPRDRDGARNAGLGRLCAGDLDGPPVGRQRELRRRKR